MRHDHDLPPGPDAGHRPRLEPREAPADGLYLYGVTRARSWRGPTAEGDSVIKVRYRDLEALVRPVAYRVPELDDDALAEHQRMVDGTLRRGTILPAPFGLVFRGRRAVVRLLEDQYIVLDEGLAFLDNHWEMRLHMAALDEDEAPALNDLCTHLYSELRRFARAAIPLRARDTRILSAAFLVERGAWIEFTERTEDLQVSHPEITFDLTGPWPPYDFVRIQT